MIMNKIMTRKNLLFFSYTIISLFTILLHEPWLDEAQAWLVARDSTFQEMFHQMKYEGSPMLWHLLLVPFAQLNFPYVTLNIIHWIIATASIYLWIYHSPFSFGFTSAFTFSYFMIFEYAIKARSYSLSILLLFALATLYNQRFIRPFLYSFLIALLCQTNIFSVFFAFGLSAMLLIEWFCNVDSLSQPKWLYFTSIAMICLSGLLAFLQVYPPQSATHPLILNHPLLRTLSIFLIDYNTSSELLYIILCLSEIGYVLASGILIVLILAMLRLHKLFIFFLFSILSLTWIEIHLPLLEYRHSGLFLIISIVVVWMKMASFPTNKPFFVETKFQRYSLQVIMTICILSIPFGMDMMRSDWKRPFSGSQEAAQYILANHLDTMTIVAHPFSSIPILPYLPKEKKFWYPHTQQYGTFIVWDQKIHDYIEGHKSIFDDTIIQDIYEANIRPCLLIWRPNFQHPSVQSLYQTSSALLRQEMYGIYMVK